MQITINYNIDLLAVKRARLAARQWRRARSKEPGGSSVGGSDGCVGLNLCWQSEMGRGQWSVVNACRIALGYFSLLSCVELIDLWTRHKHLLRAGAPAAADAVHRRSIFNENMLTERFGPIGPKCLKTLRTYGKILRHFGPKSKKIETLRTWKVRSEVS